MGMGANGLGQSNYRRSRHDATMALWLIAPRYGSLRHAGEGEAMTELEAVKGSLNQ